MVRAKFSEIEVNKDLTSKEISRSQKFTNHIDMFISPTLRFSTLHVTFLSARVFNVLPPAFFKSRVTNGAWNGVKTAFQRTSGINSMWSRKGTKKNPRGGDLFDLVRLSNFFCVSSIWIQSTSIHGSIYNGN